MKWYWVVQNDRAVADPLVVDADDLRGLDPERLFDGKPVDEWNDGATLLSTSREGDGQPDDALQNHLNCLVFSNRLRTALEDAQVKGFQFLPVRVFTSTGTRINGFSVANIIERRRALCPEKSDYDVFPVDYFLKERRGRIRALRRATLFANALRDTDAFRLDEYPQRAYVSERFVRIFDGERCTGLSFVEAPVVESRIQV